MSDRQLHLGLLFNAPEQHRHRPSARRLRVGAASAAKLLFGQNFAAEADCRPAAPESILRTLKSIGNTAP